MVLADRLVVVEARCRRADRLTARGRPGRARTTSPDGRAQLAARPRGRPGRVDREAAQQVEPDQSGDVAGAGPAGHLGHRAPSGWTTPPSRMTTRSASTIASTGSWVTTSAGAGEVGEVPPQLGAHLQPGAGVERGQRLVEQQQRRFRWPAPGPARPAGPARRRAAAGRRPPCSARPTPLEPARRPPAGRRPRPMPRARSPKATFSRARRGAGTAGSPGTPRRPAAARAARTRRARGRRGPRRRAGRARRRAAAARRARAARWSCRRRWARAAPTHLAGRDASARRRGRSRRASTRRRSQPRRVTRAHAPPQPRSRSAASTTTDTASSTRLSAIAASGSRLEREVHRERHRLGAALDVAGEGDGGAELAERPRPAQHGARRRTDGRDERQRHPPEGGPSGRPQRRRHVLVAAVDIPRSAPSTVITKNGKATNVSARIDAGRGEGN